MNSAARAANWVFVCFGFCSSTVFGQTTSSTEPPRFRPRTDTMAARDADAIRERLKALSDSRGAINPLGDYVKPKETADRQAPIQNKPAENTPPLNRRDPVDDEALRRPSLDADAQRRLKANPPHVVESERGIIGLYPPPQISSNTGVPIASNGSDDGFRPIDRATFAGAVSGSGPATIVPLGNVPGAGYVVRSNYQIGDPEAIIPPSLGIPSGNPPGYSAPPSNVPSMTAPSMNPPPIGAPATVFPPTNTYGGGTGAIPFVGAPGSNFIPAPPAYVVPGPTSTYPASVAPTPYAPPTPYASPTPYAPPTPTYSRSGGTVNSLPFVSPPPQARDARWMVSPEVVRRMEGANCATPSQLASGANPSGAGMGSSPFFYAPPTAMPMPTPRTASRHSWLHPFRH
jgi:hypothetical protein